MQEKSEMEFGVFIPTLSDIQYRLFMRSAFWLPKVVSIWYEEFFHEYRIIEKVRENRLGFSSGCELVEVHRTTQIQMRVVRRKLPTNRTI